MDDPPGNVDSGPPTGWVRLQLEPVDVPLEVDESLLLSTVQSAIPGAHGLYYNENGQKKALRFDAYSGRIYKGQPGWHSKPIFINLAHGCRTHAFGQYESATKTFEKSVSAIQRMLATSDLSSCWGPGATSQQRSTRSERKRGEEKEKAREKRVTRPTKSGFEAQAEEHLEEHSDGSIDSGRSNDLQKLQEENENLKQLLHDIEINSSKFERDAGEKGKALGKAQLRIDELLKEIEQMKLREYLDSSVTESERAAYSTLVSTPQKTALLDVDEFASLRRAKEEVERELAVEREKIYQLEKSKDELISKLEWSLGEHKQWLGDARSRISQLEGEISGQAAEFERTRLDLQAAIDRLHEKNCHLKHELHEVTTENERLKGELEKLKAEFSEGHPEVSAWDNERTNLKEQIEELKGQLAAKEHEASALHGTIGDLRSELGAKDAHIGTLNQQKNDIEWSLGEHRQWLSDANNRISGLEAELNALRTQGEEMTMRLQHSDEAAFRPEIDNLKAQILEKENELQRLRPVEETKNNEIGALRGENDWLKGELSAKDGHINDLNKLKNDAEWSLGEHRQWLSNANNRLSELENSINEKNTLIDSMQQEIQRLQKLIAEMPEQKDTAEETQQLRERIVELESKLHEVEKSLSEAPNVDELNALHAKVDGMQHEINDKNSELGNVHKLKNDAEWSLGEHRQWLADANNRINDLTNCLSDKERQIESMQKEIDELRIVKLQEGERPGQEEQQLHDRISDLEQQLSNVPKPDEINHLRAENERLVGEINDKNRIIDELNHLKNDAEWNLGEHRHWLNDAKSRISGLEAELHSKSEALNALQAQRDTSVGEDPMIARLESNVAELREELRQVTEEKIEKERENEGINKMVQGLLEDLNDKNRQLDELNKLKNDTEWKLGEHRQWLSDANNRIGELERALESKNDEADRLLGESRETIANLQQQTNDLSGQIEQLKRDKEVLEQKLETPIEKQAVQMAAAVPTEPNDGMDGDQLQAELLKKEELLDRMNREASNKDEEIKNLHHIIGDIQRQLNDKTIQLERTTHLKNDTEWSLGEHKQWLSDANNRIGQLTSEVNEKSRIIDILHHQLEELKKALDATGDAKKLMDEIKEKNRIIDDLNKLKNDTEWSLGEHKQWLNDANNRANGFENACKDKDAIIDALRKEMEELKTASSEIPHGALPSEGEDLAKLHENIQNLEEKLRDAERAIAEAPKGDEINALRDENERLVSEISDKNRIIDELNKIRDEKEWTLGEHRQWLADANNRASSLENAMKEKDAMIERLHKEIDDLKKLSEEMQHMEVKLQEAEHVVAEHVKTDEISMLNNEVDRLNNELIGKNGIIDELVQQKNDAEWKLGEHRQWLSDANNRADGLENALKEKDAIIGDLHKQLDELKELPETVRHLEHRLHEAEDQTVQAPKDEEINQLKEEIDRLNNELVEKNHMVDVLNGQKNDAEWKLGEHQHWLADANGKADWLKGENDRLCAEMGEKNRIIDDLNRIRDEKDWSLGEHRQWLSDANNRADGLERELKEKNDVIDALHKEIDELRTVKVETPEVEGVATQLPDSRQRFWFKRLYSKLTGRRKLQQEQTAKPAELRETIVNLEGKLRDTELALSEAQKADDVNKLRAETDRLVNEINEKNRIIDELNKLKGEAEWSLGEHRQWLSDANNRANGLENTVKEKDEQIGALNKELDELRAVKVETPADALNEQIEQLQSKVQELEGRLRDSEKAIAEAPKPEENNWLRSEIERLGNEIGEKNRIIDELNNLKSAAEWSLGEHRQWLSDANNRANGLENAVREKDGIIDGLRKENDELRAVKLQIPEEALTAEQVNELRETVKNLEAKLRDAPSADEVANLRGEIDRLVSEINEKNRIIDDLNRIRDEKEWQLGEHRQWLSDANNRANGLESAVREKDELIEGLRRENEELKALRGEQEEFAVREQIPELQSSLHDLEQKLRDTEKALAEAPKGDEINGLKSEVDRLVNEINEKNRIIDELNKIKDDKEWSIGEYRQWLSDAHNRANDLENALNEKDKVIEGLHKENVQLKSAQSEGIKSREGVGPKSEEFDALKDEVNRLASEINEKNRIIDDLNRIRDEKEWQLGEHRQWLSDANNRANGLECAIKDKDGFIEKLQRELDELRTVKVETSESTEHDEVKQLHEKVQDLEGQLRDKESALAQAPTPEEMSGLRCEIDRLVGEINEKNRIIDDLNRIRDEKEWQLGEHRQWLKDANNRADGLENAVKEKDGIIDGLHKTIDELQAVKLDQPEEEGMSKMCEKLKNREESLHDAERALSDAPKVEELNWLREERERMGNEINEKNRIIDDLNRIRDEKEWQLGEHRQWLSDANNRADGLEHACKEKDNAIDALHKVIDELKTAPFEAPHGALLVEGEDVAKLRETVQNLENKLHDAEHALSEAPKQEDVSGLRAEIDRLVNEINEKNRIIDDLNRIRDEKEWQLGEHRQWLSDANNKANGLENALKKKDNEIDQLREEVEELRSMTLETPFTAVPADELAVWQNEIDRLHGEINEKNRIIDDLNRIRDEKEWQLGEHRQWLSDANNRANGLENVIKEKDGLIDGLRRENDELKAVKVEVPATAAPVEELDNLRSEIGRLASEINEKNRIIDDLNRIRDEKEWQLGEHRQWLSDANNRANYLENSVSGKDGVIDGLRKEIDELKSTRPDAGTMVPVEELNGVRGEVDRLVGEIGEKNRIIDDLNRIRDEKEWQLGEHRQWLSDANNRADYLENSVSEKDGVIDGLRKEIDELKSTRPEAGTMVPVEELNGVRGEVDRLVGEINEKNRIIDDLNRIRDEKEWRLGEHRQWLSDANNRANWLENVVKEKDDAIDHLHKEIDQLRTEQSSRETENEVNRLTNEINEKNRIIDDLNKIRDEKEWHLGEHRQWLSDANNRVNGLECAIREKDGIIDDLRRKLEGAGAPGDEQNRLRSEIDRLVGEINEKNRIIDDLNGIRDAKEWSLGEHRQWLNDANNRANGLEHALREKDGIIDELRRKLEAPGAPAHELDNLRGEVNRLVNEINEKNRIIDDLNGIRDAKEWSLGEHRQWLNDANNRSNWLESVVREKDAAIEALRKQNDDLLGRPQEEREHIRERRSAPTEDLQHTIDDLRRELDEKNAQLQTVNHIKNEIEWSLGEHKQWLGDSNRRIGELSGELDAKNLEIDGLNRKIREMKRSIHDRLTFDEAEELRERCEFLETELHEVNFLLKEVENLADVKTLKGEIDRLNGIIKDKNRIIDDLNKAKADQEWSLGEHRQWLSDANNRAGWLEKIVSERDATVDALRNENNELRAENEAIKQEAAKREAKSEELFERLETKAPEAEAPKTEDINAMKAEIDRLINEINEKNRIIDELNKLKSDAEWKLGEHRQWLSDANNRANGLESACKDKDTAIDALRKEVDELKNIKLETQESPKGDVEELRQTVEDLELKLKQAQQTIAEAPKPEDFSSLNSELDRLRHEMGEKNAIIDDVNRQRDEARWSLGEHKQWLNDANNRATALENALREKEERLAALERELGELKTVKIETPEDVLQNEIAQLKAEIQDLEGKLQETEKTLGEAPKVEEINGLRAEIDRLVNEINEKNRIIDDLNRIRDEKEWQLGEHRQWLNDANNRANGLDNELRAKSDMVDNLRKENEELRASQKMQEELSVREQIPPQSSVQDLEQKLHDAQMALAEAPKIDEMNSMRAEIDRLVNEINEKNRIIDDLNRIRDEKDWQLGEHRQWLNDANNRANDLQNTLSEKDSFIGSLQKELNDLRPIKEKLPEAAIEDEVKQLHEKVQNLENQLNDREQALAEAPKPDEINALKDEVNRLASEINEKNRIIDDLNRIRDEKEWQLGEHRQWLSDANNRANGLECAIKDKDGFIEKLQRELDELRTVKVETPESTEHDEVKQLHEKVQVLEGQLRDKESALAQAPTPEEMSGLRCEIDRLVGEINEKNRIIDDLNRIRDEKEWQLGEHRQWLSDANDRANCLETALQEKNSIIDGLRRENDDLKKVPEVAERAEVKQLESQQLAPVVHSDEDINALKAEIERLVGEINEKNRIIDDLNKIKADQEWSLGEHRQWLSDANSRANNFENACNDKDAIIDALRREMEGLKTVTSETLHGALPAEGEDLAKLHDTIEDLRKSLHETEQKLAAAPNSDDINGLKSEIDRLVNEINEKNRIIDDLNRIRDEKEWQLGEHRQWLSDANNRANGLECAINEKDGFIEKLQRELDELRTVKVETPESTEHDEVKQLHEKMQDLEGQLRDKESALAQAPTPEEISGLRCEIDRLVGEINEKNRIIDDLNRIRDEKEWQLGEHRQWLKDANNRANNLENAIKDKNGLIGSLQKELDELRTVSVATTEGALQDEIKQLRDNVHDLEAKLHDSQRAATEAPKAEEINNLQAEVNRLANEINEKNRIIDDLNRIRDEKEWQLGEHRQWLSDANNRASGLENVLKEKDDVIDGLRKEIDDLKTVKVESPFTIAPVEEIDHLRSELDRLVNEINEKNRIIDDLNRIRDEKEWSLGEHRQWLSDANNRADGLEKAISEKDDIISGLRQENDDLRAYQLETSGSVDTVNKLREYVENLESQLRSSRTEIDRAPTCEELDGLRAEKDRLVNEISEKNRIIGDLNRIRDEKEWQLGEHRQWLSDANDRANGLENSIKEKDATIEELRKAVEDLKGVSQQIPELEDRIRLLERQPTESVDHAQPIAPSQDEINGLRAEIERLVNEINEKNRIIDDLNRIRDEKEWQLGEHRQWLSDANNRANALEGASADKDRLISELRKEIDELKSLKLEAADDGERQQLREKVQHLEGKLQETERLLAEAVKPDIISTLESTINELRNELADKNTQMEHLSKERNDAEWRLGEHKQWLADANKRNEELSNSLKEKEDAMKALRATHDELRARIDELERTLKEVEASAQSSKEARERSEQSVLRETISSLHGELNLKNGDIERLRKERNDFEWSLGEHRQWLADSRNRIAELEHEISKLKDGYESALKSARTEVYELHERNIKLEETLKKTEVIVINLQKEKEATRRSLILEQPRVEFKNREELEEEIKRLREKYDELSKLLKCTDELLAKLQAEAPDTADVDTLHRKVEMLNQQLNDKNAELVQLDQRKNEAEWHLGEHRQWLSDANRRIGELEKEISAVRAENGNIQQSLNARIQELEEINRNLLETINRRESELSAKRQPLDESAEHRSTATIVLEEKCPGEGAIETTRIEMVGGDLSALSKTIQDLRHELNYQKVIDTLTEQKKDTEKSLTEQTNLLSDAYKKINELEDLLSKSAEERDEALKNAAYKSVKMLQEEVEITRTLQEDEAHVRVERSVQREPTPSREDINQIRKELEELRGEMSAKNAELANLCKLKDEAEWCLGEHRQWLSDANNRNSQMSGELAEKQRAIDALNGEKEHLRREIDSLNEKIKALSTGGGYSDAQPSDETRELEARLREKEDQIHKAIAEVDEKEEEITNLHHVIEDLRNEMNEKNRIIDELNKIKADCEWSLGEHRQWLSDANGKANWLEGELNNMRIDTEAKHAEIEDLRRTIGEKDNQINELQKKIEQAASDASAARSERELTPSEEELRMLQAKLKNAVEKNELLQNELDDARVKIDYMQQQADTTKYRESVAGTGEKSPVSMEAPISSNDLNELSEELIRVSRNKYELQEKMKRIEMEAETSKERVLYLEGETRRMGEQIWLANERVANQDRELGDLHGQVSWLRSENERLGREMEEEKRKFMEAGGVDYSKYEEMRQAEATLREEKSKVEWHLGEVTQWWNDAKWRIGELEAGMAHRQWLLDQANQKVFELSSEHEYLRQFRDKAKNTLDGTFLIRRQPIDGRYKWRLAMWDENSPDDLKDYRRVWFETTAPNAKRVFLSASFVNWECALLCDNFDKENNKFGVWVDIPPGRYEFLFIVDGEWKTCDGYPTVTNEFGSQNNWRYID